MAHGENAEKRGHPGRELWGKRPCSGWNKCRYAKRLCHRLERRAARALCYAVLTGALAGCSTTAAVIERAAEETDEAVHAQLLLLCRADSVGSIAREFGSDSERWRAWCTVCKYREQYPAMCGR